MAATQTSYLALPVVTQCLTACSTRVTRAGHVTNHVTLKHHRPYIRGTCSRKSVSPPAPDLPLTRSLAFDHFTWASLIVQSVKNLPAMQETWVRFLDQEDPLEREMVTHSGILAWRIPWAEEPGGLQSMGWQESDMT